MHLNGPVFAFWAAGLTAHILLLLVLLIRHRAGTFPVFTTLIAANVLNSIALYEIAAAWIEARLFHRIFCVCHPGSHPSIVRNL